LIIWQKNIKSLALQETINIRKKLNNFRTVVSEIPSFFDVTQIKNDEKLSVSFSIFTSKYFINKLN